MMRHKILEEIDIMTKVFIAALLMNSKFRYSTLSIAVTLMCTDYSLVEDHSLKVRAEVEL